MIWRRSNKKNGARALSFASADDWKRMMRLIPGAVTPLGILNDTERKITLYLDRDFLENDLIDVHPNDNTATVWLKLQIWLIWEHSTVIKSLFRIFDWRFVTASLRLLCFSFFVMVSIFNAQIKQLEIVSPIISCFQIDRLIGCPIFIEWLYLLICKWWDRKNQTFFCIISVSDTPAGNRLLFF